MIGTYRLACGAILEMWFDKNPPLYLIVDGHKVGLIQARKPVWVN